MVVVAGYFGGVSSVINVLIGAVGGHMVSVKRQEPN
jgi:hypothetical protein